MGSRGNGFLTGHTLALNLAVLGEQGELGQAIAGAEWPVGAEVTASRSGFPTLRLHGGWLHNRFDPQREARQWAADARARAERERADTAVVIGFGLGYHLEALREVWKGKVVAIEPSASFLRLAFAARDLRGLLEHTVLRTSLPEDVEREAWGRSIVLAHPASLALRPDDLGPLRERLIVATALATTHLKVLVVSPVAGGTLPLAEYCGRALCELGQTVRVLDLSSFGEAARGVALFAASRAEKQRFEAHLVRVLGEGIRAVVERERPDLLLAMAQAPLDAATLRAIGSVGTLRALWFVEDFRRFNYWRDVAQAYDYVFTIQRGECLEALRQVTDAHLAYLPCACDPQVHRPLELSAGERVRYGSDVSFVGAGYWNRRMAFRCLADQDFRIWGAEWEGAEGLESLVQQGGVRVSPDEAVRVFNASRVNLNLHSSTYHDGVDPLGDFVNPRTFELAACGAFQLVDLRGELPALFRPGEELATFQHVSELRPLVAHYLAHPEKRQELSGRARQRALAEHTYRHRMGILLEAVVARDGDRLAVRRDSGATFADLRAATDDPGLQAFLGRLPAHEPVSLVRMAAEVQSGQGVLSDTEALVLFLHQFDEMFLEEYRA